MTSSVETQTETTQQASSKITEKWVGVARSLAPLVESEVEQGAADKIITRKGVQAWKGRRPLPAAHPSRFGSEGLDSASYPEVA